MSKPATPAQLAAARAEGHQSALDAALSQRIAERASEVAVDADDVVRLLDRDGLDPTDPAGIDRAIEGLLVAKPYLSATPMAPPPPRRSIDQGPQGGAVLPSGPSASDWLRGGARAAMYGGRE